jgi:hypothetical protein
MILRLKYYCWFEFFMCFHQFPKHFEDCFQQLFLNLYCLIDSFFSEPLLLAPQIDYPLVTLLFCNHFYFYHLYFFDFYFLLFCLFLERNHTFLHICSFQFLESLILCLFKIVIVFQWTFAILIYLIIFYGFVLLFKSYFEI